jgi:hypothetical protein
MKNKTLIDIDFTPKNNHGVNIHFGNLRSKPNVIIDISNEENDFCVSVYDERKVKMYTSAIFKNISDAKNKFIELYNTYHNELQVMYCHSYKYYLKF